MTKAEDEELRILKESVYQLLGNKCVIHGYKHKRYSFHHITYKKTDKIYSDFMKKNSKGKYVLDPLAYHRYLIPLIKTEPERFAMMCGQMHYMIETFRRWNKPMLKRWLTLVNHK